MAPGFIASPVSASWMAAMKRSSREGRLACEGLDGVPRVDEGLDDGADGLGVAGADAEGGGLELEPLAGGEGALARGGWVAGEPERGQGGAELLGLAPVFAGGTRRWEASELDAVLLLPFGEFVDSALLGDFALDHDRDAVADHLELAEQVRVDEDGAALVFELLADLADVAAALGVDAVGGLVEQDEVGVVHEGLGEADALAHALGVLLDALLGPVLHADEVEELVDALLAVLAGDAGHGAVEIEDLPALEVVGEAVVLGEVADRARVACRRRAFPRTEPLTVEGRMTVMRILTRVDLPAPLGPEQAEDLAPPDAQIDAPEGADRFFPETALVGLGGVGDVDGEVVMGARGRGLLGISEWGPWEMGNGLAASFVRRRRASGVVGLAGDDVEDVPVLVVSFGIGRVFFIFFEVFEVEAFEQGLEPRGG
jgi:hypothetical protein